MRPTELKDLVTALLAILLIAMAAGRFEHVQRFAKYEAAKSVRGWQTHRFFTGAEVQSLAAGPKRH